MPVSKDEKRIYDIQNKGTDRFHMDRLARTQANRITDVPKCRRRYQAALEILGEGHLVTTTFHNRYNELTGREPIRETTEVVIPGFNDGSVHDTGTRRTTIDVDLTSTKRTKEDKKKIIDELKAKKEKLVSGKKDNSVDDYIAFYRK